VARAVAPALFGSETLPRLLAQLVAAPDRRFTATELEELVDASHDSLHRALHRGLATGLVSRERYGRQFVYSADAASPIFAEVKSLLSKLFGPAQILSRALAGMRPPALEAAFLFGSAARAQDTLASDLDVFVVGDVSRFELAARLGEAERELGREVNAMAYSHNEVDRRLAAGDGFLREVFAGPKLMLAGREQDLPVAPA
jgi:predicted nucleotidyltransferase